MKKLCTTILALGLVACSSKGINFYDSDPAGALRDTVNAKLTPDMNILEVRFDQSPTEAPFTDVMGKASIRVIDDKEVEKEMELDLVTKETKEVTTGGIVARNRIREAKARVNQPNEYAAGAYGKVDDLDYSKIRSNLEAGGKLVTKEGFDNAGTDHYSIVLNKDKAKVVHQFTLNAKGKDATSVQGRRIVTNYVQIDFEADAAGNVKMLDPK